jgi:hypothetical protein
MSNGDDQQACCAVGACCGGAKDLEALVAIVKADVGSVAALDPYLTAILTSVTTHFDLAPKGTIKPLIEWVAEQVRKHPTYEGS